jgi:hypothetical protein
MVHIGSTSGCGFTQYLYKSWPFENDLTIEDIITASVNIHRGQGILKRQKSVQKHAKPQSEVNKGLVTCVLQTVCVLSKGRF